MFASRLWALTFLCSLGVSLASGPAAARAQAVSLDLAGCAAASEAETRALAALELRGRLVVSAHASSLTSGMHVDGARAAGDLHIVVSCRGQIAELRSQASEPRPREPARSVRPAQTSTRGFVTGGLELQATPVLGLAGALSSVVRVRGALAMTGALSIGQTRRAIDRGDLRVRSLSVRSGPALALTRRRTVSYAGLGARLTLLELAGEPSDGATTQSARFRTFLVGPSAFAGLSLALGERMVVGCELELAHELRRVRADVRGGRASELSPLRSALSLLAGARW